MRFTGADFVNFWNASLTTLQGEAVHLYDPSAYSALLADRYGTDFGYRWLYPPHFLFVILPLGLMPYWTAYLTFIAISLLAFLLIGVSLWGRAKVIPWLLIAPATILGVIMGQTAILVGTLFMAAVFWRDDRPVIAGFFFGLLTIKPHFGVLIPLILLVERRFLVIAIASLTAAFLMAASVLAFGADAWASFFRNFGGAQGEVLRNTGALLTAQLSPFGAARYAGASLQTSFLIQMIATGFAALAAIAVALSKAERDTKNMTLIVTTYLATPYVLSYDLVAPSFAAIWLYFGHHREQAPGLVLSILLVLVATLSFVNGLTVAMGFSAGPLVFAALTTALFFRAREESVRAPEHQRSHRPDETTPRASDRAFLVRESAASWR
ncbi:DUF2029 domain-containing protein [Afifella sp. H1R]|uniref:glycosyltransferase family 87 protein n=1 Tax=Afifella sp. H1R TaxID=2908841 RepID=UPI001F2E2073|nr:glycosyltransferase family 87 protein [Afifella sp. H1R]MCF1504945.1 DUF2029 domain-containing protein [Afifella sp. H1R]